MPSEVLLNERRAHVHVHLNQVLVPDRLEAVDLPCFDHEDIAGLAFELDAVDCPEPAAFTDELNLVVRMAMWPGTGAWLGAQQVDGAANAALLSADELM